MTVRLQEFIHKYEVGSGYRYLTYLLGFFVLFALALGYNMVGFRNLTTAEGMDAAQLARNLAEGRGYTTQFIRPLSLHLLRKHQDRKERAASEQANYLGTNTPAPAAVDWARLEGRHPDLANAPLYPTLLAGVLKLMPFEYPQLNTEDPFRVYRPDLWIAMFNQLLLAITIVVVFWVARKLYDEAVAWVAAGVVASTELFWRFTLSGLSSLMLMLIFVGLAGVLATLDLAARDPAQRPGRLLRLAMLAGLLLGAAGLTRYAMLCLVIPVAIYLVTLPHPARLRLFAATVGTAGVVVAPWLVRNYVLSGTLFGTAGYAIYQGTAQFAEIELERMLRPEFGFLGAADYWLKLLLNGRDILLNDLPKAAGNWILAFFCAGLLVPFRKPTLGRVRWFLVGSVAFLVMAQALGRTGISGDPTPEVAADNLVIVTAPLMLLFGVGLVFSLLDQFAVPSVRYALAGLIAAVAALPMILSLMLPGPSPVVYPPYYPPWIQAKARWLGEKDWMTADIPWAVAWYGNRQSVWMPLKVGSQDAAREDFFALHQIKPLQGLYLTTRTLNKLEFRSIAQWRATEGEDRDWKRFRALAQHLAEKVTSVGLQSSEAKSLREMFELADLHWIRGAGEDWDGFVVGVLLNQEVPTGFPLKWAPAGIFPEIFLTDSERKG